MGNEKKIIIFSKKKKKNGIRIFEASGKKKNFRAKKKKNKKGMKSGQVAETESVMRELRKRYHILHEDFLNEKNRAFDITADMTRQYKGFFFLLIFFFRFAAYK